MNHSRLTSAHALLVCIMAIVPWTVANAQLNPSGPGHSDPVCEEACLEDRYEAEILAEIDYQDAVDAAYQGYYDAIENGIDIAQAICDSYPEHCDAAWDAFDVIEEGFWQDLQSQLSSLWTAHALRLGQIYQDYIQCVNACSDGGLV